MRKKISIQVREAQWTPLKINKKRINTKPYDRETYKYQDKERILKAPRDKWFLIYKGRYLRLATFLSTEICPTRGEWHDILKVLNGKNMQPRILYPGRLFFRMEGEIKNFQDRQELKEYVTTNPALQEILRGSLKIPLSEEVQWNNQQKQVLNSYHDDTKLMSFNSNSEHQWAQWPYQKALLQTG